MRDGHRPFAVDLHFRVPPLPRTVDSAQTSAPFFRRRDLFWFRPPRRLSRFRADRSTRTKQPLGRQIRWSKLHPTLARNCWGFPGTWAAGSVRSIKDISHGLSLVLGYRLQRPTISPFPLPPPRQLPRKYLPRALQIPFRVLHRWATSAPNTLTSTQSEYAQLTSPRYGACTHTTPKR